MTLCFVMHGRYVEFPTAFEKRVATRESVEEQVFLHRMQLTAAPRPSSFAIKKGKQGPQIALHPAVVSTSLGVTGKDTDFSLLGGAAVAAGKQWAAVVKTLKSLTVAKKYSENDHVHPVVRAVLEGAANGKWEVAGTTTQGDGNCDLMVMPDKGSPSVSRALLMVEVKRPGDIDSAVRQAAAYGRLRVWHDVETALCAAWFIKMGANQRRKHLSGIYADVAWALPRHRAGLVWVEQVGERPAQCSAVPNREVGNDVTPGRCDLGATGLRGGKAGHDSEEPGER
jgi:hypothetical protein